jgi:rifampicin phosphotransferase
VAAYTRLGRPAVAVRSSATAEDLPDLSFAGQQDTYLNITSEDDLHKAIVACWSSLWTGRAIAYRTRNGVSHDKLSLAVVVQRMVESQVSGVMFTANPLTGFRRETVIDATFGLGEALVSGLVEPDQYIVDTTGEGTIRSKSLGAKAVAAISLKGGGTQIVNQDAGPLPSDFREVQALPDEQILALAQLGQRVEQLYGSPQDIEWAYEDETLYLLQSRPITSLFPLPQGIPAELLKVLFSFGSVQGVFDPITPLGRSMLYLFVATAANAFGYHVNPDTQTVFLTAGERIWINLTPVVQNTVGRKVIRDVLPLVEPTVFQALDSVWDDPNLLPTRNGISFQGIRHLGRFLLPLAGNVVLNLVAPNPRRKFIVATGERYLDLLRTRLAGVSGDPWSKLSQRLDLIKELVRKYNPTVFIRFISVVASGMASFNALNVLSKNLPADPAAEPRPGWHDLVMETTRGLPNNPTTEMDLALWQTAQAIRSDLPSRQAFERDSAAELARQFLAVELPDAAQHAVRHFLERFGSRGLAEIDLGRPRWHEDPVYVMQVLGSYIQIDDERRAPDAVFRHGEQVAQQAIASLAQGVRQAPGGWLKSKLVRLAAGRMRALLGARESPKFFIVRDFDILRQAFLDSGRDFVQAGALDRADDLLYLSLSELRAFANHQPGEWKRLVTQHRSAYTHELQRRQVPRLLLSDGRAFFEGLATPPGSSDSIYGSPVSPGSAEGRVHVLFDPRQAQLLPGEILVCPGTDPSWTPLFLSAAGLVMETGGMMTHGAVVAREYGIPAIVGVDQATRRLQTGQKIRINGSTGQITVLE